MTNMKATCDKCGSTNTQREGWIEYNEDLKLWVAVLTDPDNPDSIAIGDFCYCKDCGNHFNQ